MILGLTGGIACGKSTVARMFQELGARLLDADQIAREIVEPGTLGLKLLQDEFGEKIISSSGRLERQRLGSLVFSKPEANRLEALLHPLILQESERQLASLAQEAPVVIYEAALLIETGRMERFRPLILVTAPRELQIARLRKRDGLSRRMAEARINAQMSLEEKIPFADVIIKNEGLREQTAQQVAQLWEGWLTAL